MVFIDESGMLMAPLVQRTWAPRGQTPHLHQRMQSHTKISVIAALCIAPDRQRLHLYFRLHPDENINKDRVRAFLQQLIRQLDAPIMLVWDRLAAHRSRVVQGFISDTPGLYDEFLPSYAPELNPVEQVWSYLKMNPLANFTAYDVDTLADTTRHHTRSLQHKKSLLQSFVANTPLPIRIGRT